MIGFRKLEALWRVILVLLVGFSFFLTQSFANPRTDYVFERIIGEFVIPGFKSLDLAAKAHSAAWEDYCAAPTPASRKTLVETFHGFADRWALIEIIRHGPGLDGFRNERLYFWPERRNAVERALSAALMSMDADPIPPHRVREASAALQGLPALERILFGNDALDPDVAPGPRHCRLGSAIAQNAAEIADELLKGWLLRADIITLDAKAALATDLVSAYSAIETLKIESVVGKDGATGKPRAAEFWRSRRSNRNILFNLEALNRVNAILFETLPEDVSLPDATRDAIRIGASLTASIGDLAAGTDHSQIRRLYNAVDAAADSSLAEIPAALGVTVGFNSLDGD